MTTPNCIPRGTKILNRDDAEPGTIVTGLTFDPVTGECTEYEIRTAYGIERWQRRDFVLTDKVDRNDK